MNSLIEFTIEHWGMISALLTAIALRIIPTEKNYDIFKKIMQLIDFIIPNLKKGGGKHVAKVILFFALASVCAESFGQLNARIRQLRFATGVQYAADTAETATNAGRVWYDFATGRYRANFNGTNDFFGEGGGDFWPLSGTGTFTGSVDMQMGANDFNLETSTLDRLTFIDDAFQIVVGSAPGTSQLSLEGGVNGASLNSGSGGPLTLLGQNFDINIDNNGLSMHSSALQFLTANNQILLTNEAVTHTTSIFGGEIQIDFPGGADDVTINNTTFSVTGTPYTFDFGSVVTFDGAQNITFTNAGAAGGIDFASDGQITFSGSGSVNIETTNVNMVAQNTSSVFANGTYTPTVTNNSGVTNPTGTLSHYSRVGDQVTVYAQGQVDVSNGTPASFYVSLPITSDFVTGTDLTGDGAITNGSLPAAILLSADTTNDRAQISSYTPGVTGTVQFKISFMYTIL